MSTEKATQNASQHALFTISASPDVTTAVAAACNEASIVHFAGQFQSYFSGDRRPQLSDDLRRAAGVFAVIDCDSDPEAAIESMQRLRQMGLRRLCMIGLSTELTDGFLLRAMRAGCNEFLMKPVDVSLLQDALLAFTKAAISEQMSATVDSGRILSVFGAKGGVGATTLAVHLAHDLALRHGKRVLLIDHHYELGHVALHLGMRDGKYHFNDLIRNVSRLDTDLLNGLTTRHSSGLDVLSSPDTCSPPYPATAEDVQLVFRFLRREYEYVVVDSSVNYIDVAPAIMQGSDEAFLISTGDVASLRDLARRVESLGHMEGMANKLRIVINRSTSLDAVSPEQIETAIHFPVWLSVPNQYQELQRAMNTGQPVVAQARSPFVQSMTQWTDKLLGEPRKGGKKAGRKSGSKLLFWRSQPAAL